MVRLARDICMYRGYPDVRRVWVVLCPCSSLDESQRLSCVQWDVNSRHFARGWTYCIDHMWLMLWLCVDIDVRRSLVLVWFDRDEAKNTPHV